MMNLCFPAVTNAETFQSLNLSTICKHMGKQGIGHLFTKHKRSIKTMTGSKLMNNIILTFKYMLFVVHMCSSIISKDA